MRPITALCIAVGFVGFVLYTSGCSTVQINANCKGPTSEQKRVKYDEDGHSLPRDEWAQTTTDNAARCEWTVNANVSPFQARSVAKSIEKLKAVMGNPQQEPKTK